MDERVLQLRVGIFVLLAILILFALIYLNSEVWKGQYTVYLKPQTAPGVKINTPVRKNGILIGRVQSVQTGDDHVTVGLRIDNDEPIYENEVASIGAESILGDAVIEIIPTTADTRGNALVNDGLISTVAIRRNPMEIVDVALNLEGEISSTLSSIRATADTFEQTASQIADAGSGVNKLASTIQDAMDGEGSEVKNLIADFRDVSKRVRTALDNFNRIFENVNDVVGDQDFKNRFNDAIDTFPEIFKEVRGAVADVRETVTSFQKISDSADTNLQNLETFTASLRDNGPEILDTINDRLSNIDGVFEKIEAAADSLGNLDISEGTIGKLLNDRELYDTALEAVRNVRDQTTKIEPLVNDLRMFADSIARDPGQLGIRGAVRNRSANKTGYKGGNPAGRNRILR